MKINPQKPRENLYPVNKQAKAKLQVKEQHPKSGNPSEKSTKPKDSASTKYYTVDGQRMDALLQEQSVMKDQFRRMILDLLERQGYSIKTLEGMSAEEIKNLKIPVDETTRQEAQDLIGPDGPYGVEATSDRIIEFAKVLANKDPSRLPMLREAIAHGFDAAKKAFGGTLPEISEETHTRVMEKFDALEKSLLSGDFSE